MTEVGRKLIAAKTACKQKPLFCARIDLHHNIQGAIVAGAGMCATKAHPKGDFVLTCISNMINNNL
jgi:hypothetical protein